MVRGMNIEMRTSEYRPCLVDRREGLFHRWCDKECFYIKSDLHIDSKKIARLQKRINETHCLPSGFEIEKVKTTVAIVEFENGAIEEIEPTKITFLDSGNYFNQYAVSPYHEKYNEILKTLGGTKK